MSLETKASPSYAALAAKNFDRKEERIAFAKLLTEKHPAYFDKNTRLDPVFEKGCVAAGLIYADHGAQLEVRHLFMIIRAACEDRATRGDVGHAISLLERQNKLHHANMEGVLSKIRDYAHEEGYPGATRNKEMILKNVMDRIKGRNAPHRTARMNGLPPGALAAPAA